MKVTRRIAVVDMGSNTLKFTVTEVDEFGSEQVIHAYAETVRLGAGVAVEKRIEPERIERALLALRHYELVAKSLGVEAYIGVATAALRMASNGDDLLESIHRTTGWNVRVITGEEEARLAFQGLVGTLPADTDSVVVDIGGGSTELLSVSNRKLVASESLNLGSGTLADRHFRQDPPGLPAIHEAIQSAGETLTASTVLPVVKATSAVFSGGNGQFLKEFAGWNEVAIPFEPGRFDAIVSSLSQTRSDRLAGYLNIATERARMLPAGAAIAMAVIERALPTSIDAAPSGIRGGLVADWIARHP